MPEGRIIEILIVDDHEVVRLGLRSLLSNFPQIHVAAEAATGDEAIALAITHHPDVVLLDIRLPGRDGIDTCREIKRLVPATRIIMLTSYDNDQYLHAAMKAGAHGFLLKEIRAEALIEMLDAVMRGEVVFDKGTTRHVMQKLKEQSENESRLNQLTPVEQQVLHLLSSGKTNREIARELYLSEKTVRNYVSRILDKLALNNRTEAAFFAIRNHLDG